MTERAGWVVLDWFIHPFLLGVCAVSMAMWSRWTAVVAVVLLTVSLAVSERLAYWQERLIEELEKR